MSLDGLSPAGPARELILHGMDRRTIEKNWMLFESESRVFVVYSCSPHIILAADMSRPDEVSCSPVADVGWENEYSIIFGVMRGGAQPIERLSPDGNSSFFSITHSSYKLPEGRQYEMTAYEFESKSPFRVLRSLNSPSSSTRRASKVLNSRS